jgi:hypothetical protein
LPLVEAWQKNMERLEWVPPIHLFAKAEHRLTAKVLLGPQTLNLIGVVFWQLLQ